MNLNMTINNIYNKQEFKVAPKKKVADTGKNTFSDNDNLTISKQAQELQMANRLAKSTPDIREDKVREVQNLIESGKYKIDLSKIADKILA